MAFGTAGYPQIWLNETECDEKRAGGRYWNDDD
jgi:hypothetical protein